ncbi:hypothetical protein C7477_11542 [Phyllobacterium leguminum]|uniref:Uncharacterized protein n=1 Tax=Phyllobacterium leguminum TaxID=314237 RepID=A0A318T3D1_9HYPH|nr:hypothetical protein C7477_11542 [Phyllobacterium leguminum]
MVSREVLTRVYHGKDGETKLLAPRGIDAAGFPFYP